MDTISRWSDAADTVTPITYHAPVTLSIQSCDDDDVDNSITVVLSLSLSWLRQLHSCCGYWVDKYVIYTFYVTKRGFYCMVRVAQNKGTEVI